MFEIIDSPHQYPRRIIHDLYKQCDWSLIVLINIFEDAELNKSDSLLCGG